MKIVLTHKVSGKRFLVDTQKEPNYKDEYNDLEGSPLCCEPVLVEEVVEEEVAVDLVCCDKEYKTESSLKAHKTRKH